VTLRERDSTLQVRMGVSALRLKFSETILRLILNLLIVRLTRLVEHFVTYPMGVKPGSLSCNASLNSSHKMLLKLNLLINLLPLKLSLGFRNVNIALDYYSVWYSGN